MSIPFRKSLCRPKTAVPAKRAIAVLAAGAATLLFGACGNVVQPTVSQPAVDDGSTTVSTYSPTTTSTYRSSASSGYGTSSSVSDYGDASCRMLNDLGSTGDAQTDRMTSAVRNNYCTSSGMSSNPDSCGALREMGPTGDPETDRLTRTVLNNAC